MYLFSMYRAWNLTYSLRLCLCIYVHIYLYICIHQFCYFQDVCYPYQTHDLWQSHKIIYAYIYIYIYIYAYIHRRLCALLSS